MQVTEYQNNEQKKNFFQEVLEMMKFNHFRLSWELFHVMNWSDYYLFGCETPKSNIQGSIFKVKALRKIVISFFLLTIIKYVILAIAKCFLFRVAHKKNIWLLNFSWLSVVTTGSLIELLCYIISKLTFAHIFRILWPATRKRYLSEFIFI